MENQWLAAAWTSDEFPSGPSICCVPGAPALADREQSCVRRLADRRIACHTWMILTKANRMRTYQTSITIDAAPECVWDLLSAVVEWPRWLPTVASVEALGAARLEVGGRFKVRQPGLRPAIWTVSAIEPGCRFEWQAASPGVLMVGDHRLQRLAPHRTSVLLRFEFRGVAGSLLGLLFASTTRRYVDQEAAALKKATESAVRAAAAGRECARLP